MPATQVRRLSGIHRREEAQGVEPAGLVPSGEVKGAGVLGANAEEEHVVLGCKPQCPSPVYHNAELEAEIAEIQQVYAEK